MKINPTFLGIYKAKAEVCNKQLNVYQLTEKDDDFLNQLNIDLKKLKPNIEKKELSIWQNIFNKALQNAKNKEKESFLVTCDNKPCGILIKTSPKNRDYIDYICTWPIETNKKAPFAAKTLFMQIYQDFLNSSKISIDLLGVRYGNTISKY